MKNQHHLFLLLILFVLCSCYNTDDEKFDELNTLVETQPSKGLAETRKAIAQNKNSSKRHRMKLALLQYKGEDKCNIKHKSDSTILEIYNYLTKEGSVGDIIEANYYMGRTYHELKNYPMAALYYNSAIDIALSNKLTRKDSIVLANIYSQHCEINMNLGNTSLSHESIMKALLIKKELGLDNLKTYQDVADSYYKNMGNIDSASYYYKQCAMKIACDNTIMENEIYLASHLQFFSVTGNAKMAAWTLGLLKSLPVDSLSFHSFSSMSSYYLNIDEDIDSVLYYSKLSFNKSMDVRDKSIDARNLFCVYKYLRQNTDSALKYATEHILLSDSAHKLDLKNETESAQSLRQSQELDQMRAKIHEGEMVRNEIISYSAAAAMFLLTIIVTILYIYSKHKQRLKEDYETLKSSKEEVEEENQKLEMIMAAENKLRAESAKDVSSVIAHLNSIAYSQKETLTEDLWDDIFFAVDKVYPSLRKYILSYYSSIENKDLILIYLVVLGMKQADIARLFKNSRTLINRKFHRLDERLGTSISEVVDSYIASQHELLEQKTHASSELQTSIDAENAQ